NASKIPFAGPIAATRVGRVQDNWVLNPTFQQLEFSDMELVMAGSKDSIVMVEGGALEVSEEDIIEAITIGHKGINEIIGAQEELFKAMGKDRPAKMQWTKAEVSEDIQVKVKSLAEGKIVEALNQKE